MNHYSRSKLKFRTTTQVYLEPLRSCGVSFPLPCLATGRFSSANTFTQCVRCPDLPQNLEIICRFLDNLMPKFRSQLPDLQNKLENRVFKFCQIKFPNFLTMFFLAQPWVITTQKQKKSC